MNQTLRRLEMIKTAISIGDMDVVHLLHLKIAMLTHDAQLQRIAEAIHGKNYVVAGQLIDAYLQNPPEEHTVTTPFDDDESLKEAFELFETLPEEETTDTIETLSPNKERDLFEDILNIPSDETDAAFDNPTDMHQVPENMQTDDEDKDEPRSIFDQPPIDAPIQRYEAVTYAEQKYLNLKTQYPPTVDHETLLPTAQTWLERISTQGCDENDVETMIETALKRKEEGRDAEAAQLILVAAVTPSMYAEYILARELFRGDILQQNRQEAVDMLRRLAENEGYGEALCDYAQCVEHGIETAQDRKKAERLYQEAMHAGIRRAEAYYMRLHKANRNPLAFWRR